MIRRTLYEQAQYVCATVEELGFRLNPTSRLSRMRDVLERAQRTSGGIVTLGSPDFPIAREALRDVQVVSFILDNAPIADPVGLQRLRDLTQDPALPQDGKARSPGRDAQFELFVYAVLMSAGAKPAFAEPDVVASVGDLRFGVAAKRIKRFDRLEQHLRRGASQIVAAGLPGVIAVDVAFARNPNNEEPAAVQSSYAFGQTAAERIARFKEGYAERIRRILRGKPVRGLIVHDHDVLQDSGKWSLSGITFPISCSQVNQRREREFVAIYEAFQRGLPKPIPFDAS